MGEFAPEFAHLNDDILFGEVWSRNDLLSLRDRSLVTITSLISQGITDSSLKYHLQSAKNNGITRTEVAGRKRNVKNFFRKTRNFLQNKSRPVKDGINYCILR